MKGIQALAPGSHLVSARICGAYTHHGIYIGNNQVIHYAGLSKNLEPGDIEKATLDHFFQDSGYRLQTYKQQKYTGGQVVERAQARLDNQKKEQEKYHVITNNCEHFCQWCITGDHSSQQVNKLLSILTTKTVKTVLEAVKGGISRSPPVTVVTSMSEMTASITRYLGGKSDLKQLTQEISHSAVTNASLFYYGALGQTTIPIPILGALTGATVGYLLGNILCQSGLIALGEADVVRAARERRELIESFCAESIVQQQQYRQQLEHLLEQHFTERQQRFSQAFSDFDQSLITWDETSMVTGLESINHAFGKNLPFKSFDEFSGFMQNKEQVLVF